MMRGMLNRWLTPPKDGWTCAMCGCPLDYPGACYPCAEANDKRIAEHNLALSLTARRIPPRFYWATFDSVDLPSRVAPDMLEPSKDAARRLKSGEVANIVLLGPAGCGKTSLACATLRYLWDGQSSFSGLFCASTALSVARSDSELGRRPELLDSCSSCCVLVLDDLGQEAKGSEVLKEVLHARHDAALPTIVTTWMTPAAIAARYGDGTARRVFEKSAVVGKGS